MIVHRAINVVVFLEEEKEGILMIRFRVTPKGTGRPQDVLASRGFSKEQIPAIETRRTKVILAQK